MDIEGFIEAIDILHRDTVKSHRRNIQRLDEIIDIYDEPSFNIKILYIEEKRIPTLMSLNMTIMNYLNFIDIDDMTEYGNEYNKVKNKYDDYKKQETRKYAGRSKQQGRDPHCTRPQESCEEAQAESE